jgi:hypothetical protein
VRRSTSGALLLKAFHHRLLGNMMVRLSELVGRNVVSQDAGAKVGEVADVLADAAAWSVLCSRVVSSLQNCLSDECSATARGMTRDLTSAPKHCTKVR